MNLRFLPLLVAGIAAWANADRIPVLSEPRSVELGAISFDAWGDTLIASRWGKTWKIVRSNDEMLLLDSIVDDSLSSEMPRTFQTGLGTHLQVAAKWVNNLVWTQHVAVPALVDSLTNGYSRVEGDAFHKGDTTFVFYCSPTNSHLLQRIGAGPWTLRYADTLTGDTLQICAVDPKLRQTVRVLYAPSGNSRFRISNSSEIPQRFQSDTIQFRPTAAFIANDDAILYFDSRTGTVRLGGTAGKAVFQPAELANRTSSYTQPVLKDSLIVFGVDSSLVLAKWIRNRFQVIQTIHLDSRVNHPLAIGDSVLWVGLGSRTVSFRLTWQERTTGVSPRAAALAPELARVRRLPDALQITWNGTTETTLQVATPSGAIVAHAVLGPASSTKIPVPGQSGLLILHTNQGSRAVMATK